MSLSRELTDSELLRRHLAGGEEAAFAMLVERHLALVYHTALRRLNNDPTQAQEVAQNVFILLARRAMWLAEHPSLAGWLYRTAVHLAEHELRTEQRRRRREQTALELGTLMKPDDSPLSQISPVLDEALMELGAADREALVLRFFAHKSLREVGAALGVREDAAQKRVAKALDALTERFRRRGFRVAATAVTAVLAQQASAGAAPAGLAALTTKAALGAGAAGLLANFAGPIAKIMTLTKTQTAALCVALALVPIGYEWRANNHARAAAEQLNGQLAALRTDALAGEQDQSRADRRVAELQNQLARTPVAVSKPAAQIPIAANLYLWDEGSPYVRLPKSALTNVHFAAFATRVARDGKIERYQAPSLAADGTLQPALQAALGLSPDESGSLNQICQATFTRFNELAAAHSELTEQPLGPNTTMKLKTAAFADDGAQLRDQFKEQVAALLGSERAATFWQQASPEFTDLLNDFGAYPRELQLVHNAQAGTVELFNMYHTGSGVAALDQRNGLPLPPMLQSYADAWTKEFANQPAK
jgi:RNA polymerase sigma factor (sigma-70 family)